jgi:hypothetical protein
VQCTNVFRIDGSAWLKKVEAGIFAYLNGLRATAFRLYRDAFDSAIDEMHVAATAHPIKSGLDG